MSESKNEKSEKRLTKADIDFFTAGDILQDIDRVEAILNSGIFEHANRYHPLVKSAFTELMICLRDLTEKTKKYGTPISFTEDVVETKDIKDVSALIKFIRDAMCHVWTYHHDVVPDWIKVSFFIVYGRRSVMPFPNDNSVIFDADYTDDVCFFFGLQKIYLRRHIIRAFVEVKRQLLPLPEFPNDIFIYQKPNP